LEIDERAWLPYVPLVFGYYMQGRIPEALAAAEKGYQCAPWHPRMTGQLAGLLSRTGNTDRAEALIRPMQADPNRSCAPTGMILYHLIRSEIDAAADWYEKAIEQRDPIAIPWITNPLCAPLRASPRWAKIAKMMNLQEMYREAGETP